MKNLILSMVLLFTLPFIAQEKQNTITVIGETEKEVTDNNYTILVSLQQILIYEGQMEMEATSLAEVTRNYKNKLEEIGIDFSRFRRNTYYEFTMSYSQSRKSAYYYLKTPNKEEVRKIVNLKSAGVSLANIEVETKKLTNEQLVKLSGKAVKNAKQKAEDLAKKLNKTVGEIVNISDQNTNTQYMQNYGTETTQNHSVTVAFELK